MLAVRLLCALLFFPIVASACAGQQVAETTTPSVTPPPVVTVAAAPRRFVAYLPEGFRASVIYADFARIRQSTELAPALDAFRQYLEQHRPDVSAFFGTDGLSMIDDSSVAVLASPVGRWSWIMTIDYDDAAAVERGLLAAAPGPEQRIGSFAVREVRAETHAPLVAHPEPHRVALGTPDGVQAAASVEPLRLDFVPPDAFAAWRLRGSARIFRGMPAAPDDVRASVRVLEQDARPIRVDADLTFEDAVAAEQAEGWVHAKVAELQRQSFVARVLLRGTNPLGVSRTGTHVNLRLQFTPEFAQMLAQSVLSGLRGP